MFTRETVPIDYIYLYNVYENVQGRRAFCAPESNTVGKTTLMNKTNNPISMNAENPYIVVDRMVNLECLYYWMI